MGMSIRPQKVTLAMACLSLAVPMVVKSGRLRDMMYTLYDYAAIAR
jgi:hypothetical protein